MALHEGDPDALGGYRIVDRLGAGGMGVVYRARSRSGREVAVKVVHAQYAGDAVFRARFRQEIEAVRKVSGAFTAPVVDADPEAPRPWMATQYVPGRSLSAGIRADGPLRGAELRRLALGLVEALRDIHRAGVVHRDLKPANVLMAEDSPRVIDFGISRAAENQTLTETGHMMGTPPFMSPEQLADARSVGPASDVFSLGALVVFAATGRGPFDADNPYLTAYRVMNEEPDLAAVTEPLRTVLSRCLAKDPAARPGLDTLAGEFAVALPESPSDETPTVPQRPEDPEPTRLAEPARAAPSSSSAPGAGPAPAEGEAVHGASAPRTRNRRLPLLAGVVGVLVAVLMAYLLGPLGGGDTAEGGGSPSPAATRWGDLPGGWRPWQTTVLAAAARGVQRPRAPQGPDSAGQPSCALSAGSVYCGGNSTLPVRVDAVTGRVLWRADTDPPGLEPNRYNSMVIGVHEGVVLVRESVLNTAANDTAASVVAFRAADGRRMWSRPMRDDLAPAVLVGGLVLTLDGPTVTARSPRDGSARWSTTTVPTGYGCDFLSAGDALYVDCTGYHTPSGVQRRLIAVDLADGSARRAASAPPEGAAYAGTLDGRLVFVGRRSSDPTAQDNPYARVELIDPRAGTRTTRTLDGEYSGRVTVTHGVLCFAAAGGRMTALSPLTGKRLWQTPTTLERPAAPVADGRGSVFVPSASGRVAALDARTGHLLWESYPRADIPVSGDYHSSELLFNGGALVVTTPDGTIFTLDPAHPERKPAST
ncbi:PQQ-binding-like beta-propeller repeat protein [Streptomyces sp. NPDC101151]|uniref:protein kinase domain-containing protein n=1 Tax=Streptomyces sp. NPDC101151 TaxID=3366115 RepID=UPI0038272140